MDKKKSKSNAKADIKTPLIPADQLVSNEHRSCSCSANKEESKSSGIVGIPSVSLNIAES
jgi:hypothetical protein